MLWLREFGKGRGIRTLKGNNNTDWKLPVDKRHVLAEAVQRYAVVDLIEEGLPSVEDGTEKGGVEVSA